MPDLEGTLFFFFHFKNFDFNLQAMGNDIIQFLILEPWLQGSWRTGRKVGSYVNSPNRKQ